MNQPKNQMVMMLVSHHVRSGNESRFEREVSHLVETAANFPGCLGAQLVPPGNQVENENHLYHAMLAFENPDAMRAWQQSPERATGLAAAAAYIEGRSAVREVQGLAHWFQVRTGPTSSAPPRWKVAIVTWLGICPTVYLAFLLLGDVLSPWWLLPRIVVLTMLVVTVMTWIVAPQLTRLLKPWLYSSKSSK